MFFSQFVQALRRWCQLGRMGLASQSDCGQDPSTLRFDIALQVRQGATHTDKVIDQHIFAAGRHLALKFSLSGQPPKAIGTSVANHVGLNNPGIHWPFQHLTKLVCKHFRNGVDAFSLKRMCAHQRWSAACGQCIKCRCLGDIEIVEYQVGSGVVITRFCKPIGRVLLYGRFGGVDKDLRKIAPRSAGRLGGDGHGLNLPTPAHF